MAILPVVSLFFPCAGGQRDPEKGTMTLINPLRTVRLSGAATFPFSFSAIFFYAQLVTGLGSFLFRVEARDERNKLLARTKPVAVEFAVDDRDEEQEMLFQLPPIEIKKPGVCTFELFANHAPIAQTQVRFLTSARP
jgi:hypothetical protein